LTIDLPLAGETLRLLPQRAAYWARRKLLMVADIHFGKAASFRALGVPVPHGTTSHNLARLETLLATHEVVQIVFLGDFLHARAAHASATLAALRAWRDAHPALALTLVRGNHDRHAGDPPPSLNLRIVDEPYLEAPFAFCHHPKPIDGWHVIAGHLHPVHRLSGRADSLRLPCFVVHAQHSILPAFGDFTGGHVVAPAGGQRVFVSSGEQVFEVPQRPPLRAL
jgi:uncharacterized protein